MNEHSNQSKKVTIIVVVVVVLIAAGAIWYGMMYLPAQEAKEKARQEQLAKEAAEKKRAEEAKQKKERFDQLIVDADAAYQEENWESARDLYSEASSLFPEEGYPRDQLDLVNQKLDAFNETAAEVEAGAVETLSTKTGLYYVIVSSSLDDDLAMDYAQKLALEGKDVKIIEHDTGEYTYYRVALGGYASWNDATTELPSYENDGSGVWILAY
jgi:type II secretory pathway pseudopilin PulG